MAGSRDKPERVDSALLSFKNGYSSIAEVLLAHQGELKLRAKELQDQVDNIHALAISTIGVDRFHRKPQVKSTANLDTLYKNINGSIKVYLEFLMKDDFTKSDNFKFREDLASSYEDILKKINKYKFFLFEYVLTQMITKIKDNKEKDAFRIVYPFLNICKNGLDKPYPAAERRFAVSLMLHLLERGHFPLIELLIENYNYKVTSSLADIHPGYTSRGITTRPRNFFGFFMLVYKDRMQEAHFTSHKKIRTQVVPDIARIFIKDVTDDLNKIAILMHHAYIKERLSDPSEENFNHAIEAIKSLYEIIPTMSPDLKKSDFFNEKMSEIIKLFLQSNSATLKTALPYLPLSNDELMVQVAKSKDVVHEVIFVEALLARDSFDVSKVFSPIIIDQIAIHPMVHEKIEEILQNCKERQAGSETQVVALKKAIDEILEKSDISISEKVKLMLSEIISTRNKIRKHFASNPHSVLGYATKGSPTPSALESLLKDLVKNLPIKHDEQKVAAACDPGNKELSLDAIVPPENWGILQKIDARLVQPRLSAAKATTSTASSGNLDPTSTTSTTPKKGK